MSLDQYSTEEVKEMSMLEVAYEVFLTKKQAITFKELVEEVQNILDLSQEEVNGRIAQFYTDLNIDGRFIFVGEAGWGLRSWYPYEQIDEEVQVSVKPKKRKKGKAVVEDDDLDLVDEFDELDEDDLDYDDLDEFDEEEDEDDSEDSEIVDIDEVDDVDNVDEPELDEDDFDADEDLLTTDEEFELDDEELEEEEIEDFDEEEEH